jgi:putative two-component system response regulator
MAHILAVDDSLAIQRLIQRLLEREGHSCDTASSAEEALEWLSENTVDLVLSDVNMPGVSGIELVKQIGEKYPDIPYVMVTAVDDPDVGRLAVSHGAYGYIIKPFEPNEIVINIHNALRRAELERENRDHRERLEDLVAQRTADLQAAVDELREAHAELTLAKEEVIRRLSIAAEIRDEETGQHIQRMSLYCSLLATLSGLSQDHVDLIRVSSPLHDAGKIGIPDAILRKPGRHTTEEFAVMKKHAEYGYKILKGSGFPILDMAATIAWTHHERWDGNGYPRGLSREDIPLEGRITAIADVFDALTTKRIYKPAFSVEKSVMIMKEGHGKHFDPDLLQLFLDNMDAVLEIRSQFPDEEHEAMYEWVDGQG